MALHYYIRKKTEKPFKKLKKHKLLWDKAGEPNKRKMEERKKTVFNRMRTKERQRWNFDENSTVAIRGRQRQSSAVRRRLGRGSCGWALQICRPHNGPRKTEQLEQKEVNAMVQWCVKNFSLSRQTSINAFPKYCSRLTRINLFGVRDFVRIFFVFCTWNNPWYDPKVYITNIRF